MDEAQTAGTLHIEAALAALPRPNQAYWTLSALWAGWLWGIEAAAPFKSVLRRRRYDWGWHTAALSSGYTHISRLLSPETPVLGLAGEAEPGFLSAALIAADLAGLELQGLALRTEAPPAEIPYPEMQPSGMPRAEEIQAQVYWQQPASRSVPANEQIYLSGPGLQEMMRQTMQKLLEERAEPCSYLHLHGSRTRRPAQPDPGCHPAGRLLARPAALQRRGRTQRKWTPGRGQSRL